MSDQIMSLYRARASDVEIGRQLGMSKTAVRRWRLGRMLPPNVAARMPRPQPPRIQTVMLPALPGEGACVGHPMSQPEPGRDPGSAWDEGSPRARDARDVCARCPVRDACLTAAGSSCGMWGGLDCAVRLGHKHGSQRPDGHRR